MDAAVNAASAEAQPVDDRRKADGSFLFRLRPAELISVIALVSGFVLWLADVSATAGRLGNRIEKVEADTASMRATLEAVRETVVDLRVGIEARGSDLRERLARIEGLLAPTPAPAGPR